MRVRSNWVTICERADGFVRAEAYRVTDNKKKQKKTIPFRRFCHAEAYGPPSASDRNLIPIENWKSSVLCATQSLWRWKLRSEQYATTNKNLISPASLGRVTLFKSSRRMSFIFWHILPRARKLSTFLTFVLVCALLQESVHLLNVNFRFAVSRL